VFLYEYPITIAAVLTAAAAIGKAAHWVYRWMKRLDGSLAYIEKEMRFNGGTTMRDALKRIESRLTDIEQNQEQK